jgi:hypothetical protein
MSSVPLGQSGSSIGNPAQGGFAVTPSDTVDFTEYARGLYVGVTGNVVVVAFDGSVLTFVGVPAGAVLPIVCRRVNATSTTATSILGLV